MAASSTKRVKKEKLPYLHTTVCRGAKIRYADLGRGRVVVLLHGFLESLDVWFYNGFADELAKKYRIIAIDLPGHGKSDCLGYVHKMERLADVVKDVMDHLSLRRYVIVGHSLGGYVALAFAEQYLENISGLCLFHSTALADSEEKRLDRDRAIRIVKRNTIRYTHPLITNLFALANVRYMKKEITWLRRLASRTKKQGIVATLEGMKIRRNRELVIRFAPFPVFIIAGKRDNVIPYHTLEEQAKLPKTCRLLALERVGHMGFIEAREVTLKKLRAFVGACYKRKFSL